MATRRNVILIAILLLALVGVLSWFDGTEQPVPRTPEAALKVLRDGNERFREGRALNPRTRTDRLRLAASGDQADYALATVLACSDSRVPVSRVFDVGIMDVFTVRVAGNVVRTDEAGSIEYGLAHVRTPLLVILGHTRCGAVAAVTDALQGHGHELERNIEPLLAPIRPAVARVLADNPSLRGAALARAATEANVWQALHDLFLQSPATRRLVASGAVKAMGAVYDVGTAEVHWLDENRPAQILAEVEQDPARALNAMAVPDGDLGREAAAPSDSAAAPAAPAATGGGTQPAATGIDAEGTVGSLDLSKDVVRAVETPEMLAKKARAAADAAARAAEAAAAAAQQARAAAEALEAR
ncbi:MAG: carbonic anhydrase [Desulfovibrionaceae bacterium]|jgi:carbonic anhydrase|nr:carbonic anhydrase [Desulfovibrionaceae bacterium]